MILQEIFLCPVCKGDLELEVHFETQICIEEGLLTCQACGRTYPIKDGLIYFSSSASLSKKREVSWNLQSFEMAYRRNGYYEDSYKWRERHGIPKVVTDYDYPRVKGRLLDWLRPRNDDLILDNGTGAGYFIFEMMNRYPNIRMNFVGLDVSKEHLKWLAYRRKREYKKNILAVVGDATNLPFKNEVFNLITCTEVLEHIFDPGSAVSEIDRVLKPKGRALLSTPSKSAFDFWNAILFAPRCLLGKKGRREGSYDHPLYPKQLINFLSNNNFDILKYELNVVLPPQSMFSQAQHYRIPMILVPKIIKICDLLEDKMKYWFRSFALHMVIEAKKGKY